MTAAQIALYLLCVALATCAQSLSGFAFALVLLGLAGLLELAPLANVATVLGLANALMALRGAGKRWMCRPFATSLLAERPVSCWAGSVPT